jgi:hypothetical protein
MAKILRFIASDFPQIELPNLSILNLSLARVEPFELTDEANHPVVVPLIANCSSIFAATASSDAGAWRLGDGALE